MNRGNQRYLEACRRDRDWLLEEYRQRRGLCSLPVPALIIDEVIQDVLELDLVMETLPGSLLGQTDYDQRLIQINDRVDISACPNTDLEGLANFTKGHEIGHWRVFDHERVIRAEVACGQLSLQLLEGPPPIAIVCRAPWSKDSRKITHEEKRRESQADMYARAFLVPECHLASCRPFTELADLAKRQAAASEKMIWRLVYEAARHFHVTATMMRNVLEEVGLITMSTGCILLSGQCELDGIAES